MENKIVEAMAKLDKNSVLSAVKEELERNKDPLQIIEDLRRGLDIVGEKYENGEYFLLELIMAGEIFKDASSFILPKIKERYGGVSKKGKVLIGTVAGDIHDLGKNIVSTLLECAGFEVIDLGVDVPAEVFVEKIKEHKPEVVAMSGLLTASIDEMNKTIEAIKHAGLREKVKVIVGGGIVGEEWTVGKVKADAATTNAAEGVKIIEGWVKRG
jgi:methylmalonyl-CoA mutase cobalamin-binding domain/chain